MAKSKLWGLSEKDMKAYIDTFNFNDYYYPTLMPLQFSTSLSIKYLKNNYGIAVAADVVSHDATLPTKARPGVFRVDGEIPKIGMKMPMKESQLNEYQNLYQYARSGDTAAQRQLLDVVYDDLKMCFDGINQRLDWIALKALSLGKVSLSSTDNEGVVTAADIDFLVPTANKSGVSVVWSVANAATAKPITDLKAKMKTARQAGTIIKYALMNQDTFDIMVQIDEVQKLTAPYLAAATSAYLVPTLAQVNAAFSAKGLPEVKIIERYVNIEINGSQTTGNPFTDNVVTLVPDLVVGNTVWANLAEELAANSGSSAYRVRRGPVMLKKWCNEEPYVEYTAGVANALPVWGSANRSYLIDTNHASTWNH
ncbi:MAG TPA: major capsid protein [Bacteroidales bacterium]|nr:major capsid protein [Bacteroidales bacterium]